MSMAKKGFRILDLILPREIKLFEHLNEQVDIFYRACIVLDEFIRRLDKLNDKQRKAYLAKIKAIENEGDEKERELIEELDDVFILPIDREDIHAIVLNIDNAIDLVFRAAKTIDTHGIKKNDKFLLEFSKVIKESSTLLQKLIYSIEKQDGSSALIAKIHKLEHHSDEIYNRCMKQLFKTNDALEIVRRRDIYDMLESLVDTTDGIAKLIRGVLVKKG